MKILVIGATGGTGKHLVKQALNLNYNVTAFVRNKSKLEIEHPNLEVYVGDVLDQNSLNNVMKDHDIVISALGHKKWFIPTQILSEGTRNILKAMETHNVERFICETSLGVGNSYFKLGLYYSLFVIPLILPFYYYDKNRQEAIIKNSDLAWTIIRPGILNNRKAQGIYKHGLSIGNWTSSVSISRADVAEFMLKQIKDQSYIKQTPGVCW